MKKLLSLLLCMVMIFTLFGCDTSDPESSTDHQTDPPPSTTLTPPETAAPTTEPDSGDNIYDAPLVSLSMPIVTENKTAEGLDVVIFSKRFQNVSLTVDGSDVSETVMLDLLNRLDSLSKTAEEVYVAAQNDYKGQDDWYHYYTSVVYEPTRVDQTLLSFYGTEEIFDGTPRSSTVNVSVTYDLFTGEEITLKSVLREDFSADTLCELIVEGLSDYSEDSLFENYEKLIGDMFSRNVPMDSWYFSETGLCFFFNPYEIAPLSMGTVCSEVPYSYLLGIIKERYFPEEEILYSGTMTAIPIDLSSPTALDNVNRFTELHIGENAGQILLQSIGSVTDVRIYTGSMGSDGQTFYKGTAIFAGEGLGPNDGIIIHLGANLNSNTLAIEYRSNGQTNLMLLHLNDDGSAFFLE